MFVFESKIESFFSMFPNYKGQALEPIKAAIFYSLTETERLEVILEYIKQNPQILQLDLDLVEYNTIEKIIVNKLISNSIISSEYNKEQDKQFLRLGKNEQTVLDLFKKKKKQTMTVDEICSLSEFQHVKRTIKGLADKGLIELDQTGMVKIK